MACWLVKADPDDYGFAALERDGETAWSGVANALARRHLAAMRAGDPVFVYETGKVRAVVGTARVAAPAAASPPAPRLAAGRRLARPVPLAEIKSDAAFARFDLVRLSRLSVMPVPPALARRLERLARS
jgi:predicted RNA-binding protein with PUA-like domain